MKPFKVILIKRMSNTSNTKLSGKAQRMIDEFKSEIRVFFEASMMTYIDKSAFGVLSIKPSDFPKFDPTLRGEALVQNCFDVVMELARTEDIDRFYKFIDLMRRNKQHEV